MNHEIPGATTKLPMDFRLFEATPGLRFVFAPEPPHFAIVAASNDICHFLGRSRQELLGKPVFEAFPASPDDPEFTGHKNLRESLEHVVQTRTPHQMERQRYDVAIDGGGFREIYWQNTSTPVLSEAGELLCIIHTTEDITEKVLSERRAAAIKALQTVNYLFTHAPLVTGLARGKDYVLELANEEALNLWGKSADIIGRPMRETLPELAEQGIFQLFDQVMETGQPFIGKEVPVFAAKDKEQKTHYFDVVYQPFYEDGKDVPTGVFTWSYNVTKLVEARREVEESGEKYRGLFQSMDQGFCVLEMLFDEQNRPVDYRFLEINPVFESQTGLKDAIGKTARELVPGLEQHWFERYGKVALTGKPIRFTEGSDVMGRWFDVYAYRTGGNDSRKVALLFTDITGQRQNEKKLRESEERFRNMVEQAPVAITLTRGHDVVIESINAPMLQMMGKTRIDEVLGEKLIEVLPELNDQAVLRVVRQVLQTGEPFSGAAVPVDLIVEGELQTRFFDLSYTPILENGKAESVVHVAIDVTEQVVARKKLEEGREALQMAIDIAELGTFTVDLQANRVAYSERIAAWFGFPGSEVDVAASFNVVHPDDRNRVLQAIQQTMHSEADSRHDLTCRVPGVNGAPDRYLRSFGRTFFDAEGKAFQIRGVIQDVTAEIQYQQQIEQNEILLQQRVKERTRELEIKNGELEQFAYAASHDMQEPLRKISTFSNFLLNQNHDTLDERSKVYLSKIGTSVSRMKTIIDDLLQYSYQTREDRQFVRTDLANIMEHIEADLDLVMEQKAARLEKGSLPVVMGVPNQLQQLFYNLITNALKFSRDGVPPCIRIVGQPVTDASLLQSRGLPPQQRYVLITVQDNGIGFAEEYATQIFTLFKRLHGRAEYEGTGIGLALCKKIAENHGGAIWAESSPGEGACFYILLPAATEVG